MTAWTFGTPVTRTALRQIPTMPRCEHEVTTTSPRPRTLATSVCSPMNVSGPTVAVALDLQVGRDRLERLLGVHLAAQQHALGDASSAPRTISTRTS